MNDSHMPPIEQREHRKIRYYQWVPFVLLLQALFLYVPRFVWKQLRTLTSAPFESNISEVDLPSVTVALRKHAKTIRDPLDVNMILKPIYFIGWFMGAGHLHGLRVVVDALNGQQWEQSGNFPRVNMFNEKIFVFLWWWFYALLFLSLLNFIRWIIRLSFDSQRMFITAVLVL
ncbi:unnamed protein product [Angiostrongylus costaricensis]|uniref:Innexin n=1 Tax=Angiostrongylus costaricensis TaxID=334426 RepID=A0A0R3PLT6_ANGCS|nr:unnamed protein product [Angiostrongylus costaricensis]